MYHTNATFEAYYSYARHGQISAGVSRAATDSFQWNMIAKLLLLSFIATVGTIGNVFAVSAVMLDDQLKRIGNAFIVNLAIADFLVSAFAIPATSVAILAGKPESPNVCTFQWVAGILCYHVSVLSLMFIALESHERILSPVEEYNQLFTKNKISVAVTGIWLTSTLCVACQFLLGLGPDYCHMVFKGHIFYHLTVGAAFYCVPTVLTFSAYFRCLFALKDENSVLHHALMTSSSVAKNVDLMKTNFTVFLTFLAFWFPLGIVVAVGSLRPISRRLYENLSWLAFGNSCVNCYVYGFCNRFFRTAYNKLFHYCFCKTSVSFGREGQRRTINHLGGCIGMSSSSNYSTPYVASSSNTTSSIQSQHHHHHHGHHHHYHHQVHYHSSQRPATDVRVHIIPGYNIYAPQRNRTDVVAHREVKTFKNGSKGIYEL